MEMQNGTSHGLCEMTDAYVEYYNTQKSKYIHSAFPLVSIGRLRRFYDRDLITPLEFNMAILRIFSDVIKITETVKVGEWDPENMFKNISCPWGDITEEAKGEIEEFKNILTSMYEANKKESK